MARSGGGGVASTARQPMPFDRFCRLLGVADRFSLTRAAPPTSLFLLAAVLRIFFDFLPLLLAAGGGATLEEGVMGFAPKKLRMDGWFGQQPWPRNTGSKVVGKG